MGLNYTTDLDDEDERSLEEALRAAADERRGYVATPDPASSVAEAGTRAPALTAPRAPVAPPTFIPEPEPERGGTAGPDDDLSTGMPDDVRAFEEGMTRYRTSNGRLPELPAGDAAIAEDPDAVMDDMTEDEILAYAAESDPYSTPEQDARDPAEAPVGKVRNAEGIKAMGSKGPLAAPEDPNAVATPNFDSLEDDLMSGMAGTGLMPEAEADMDFSYPEATRSNVLPAADMEFSEEDVAAAESPNFPGLPTADMEFSPEPDMEFAESALYPGLTDADMEFSTEEAFSAPPARANVNADMSFPGMEQGDGDAAFASTEGGQGSPLDQGGDMPEGWADAGGALYAVDGTTGEDDPQGFGMPGRVSPDALDQPGYPADDNEMVEASMGIDDDEVAELPGSPRPPGGMALADPRMPPEASGAMEASAGAKVPTEPGSDPRALDYGLPTEGEIGNERGWDVLRQITGRLGNALRVAGGGSHRDIETVAPGMEAARREGIEGRLNAKGASAEGDRRATRDAELAEDVARARREPTELELSREARIAADSERDDALTGRRLDLTERGLDDRATVSDAERAERVARTTPGSDISRAAQARLRAELDAMATSPRLRAVADSFRAGLEGMSAEDVERIERSQLLRPFLNWDGGGSGTGGLGAAGMSRADRGEVLVRAAVERGMAEDVARATLASLGAESFSRTILSDSMATNRAALGAARSADAEAAANEVIPGVPARAGIDVGAPEARGIRNRVERYRSGWVSLGEMERIAREHGAGAIISPEIRAEIEPYLFDLIGMGAAVQNSGTLNAGERPIIAATLPDPASIEGMTLGGFTGALRGWRGLLNGATGAAVSVVAPGARNREAAQYFLHTGEVYEDPEAAAAPAGGAAPTGDTVRVRLGNGRTANLPRDVYEAHRDEVEVIE